MVAKWTGIPVSKLMESEVEKLIHMEERLHERVIGQDEAVEAVSNALRRSRAGLQDPNRPIGAFLFIGPTGVGKTELARALAEFMFDSEQAMVRIDMSEYMEKHSVARLVGAPPGYVGYEEGGQLTEAVRRRPYSVVLLDEIEKAHSDVFNVLLQVMDDGRLTDGQGRTVDFKNAVLIMTSNVAGGIDGVRATFKPEFINRLDEIVEFHQLTREELGQIVEVQVDKLAARVRERGVEIELTDDARTLLGNLGYDPTYGARPLKRVIQKQLIDKLALKLLEGEFAPGDRVPRGRRGRRAALREGRHGRRAAHPPSGAPLAPARARAEQLERPATTRDEEGNVLTLRDELSAGTLQAARRPRRQAGRLRRGPLAAARRVPVRAAGGALGAGRPTAGGPEGAARPLPDGLVRRAPAGARGARRAPAGALPGPRGLVERGPGLAGAERRTGHAGPHDPEDRDLEDHARARGRPSTACAGRTGRCRRRSGSVALKILTRLLIFPHGPLTLPTLPFRLRGPRTWKRSSAPWSKPRALTRFRLPGLPRLGLTVTSRSVAVKVVSRGVGAVAGAERVGLLLARRRADAEAGVEVAGGVRGRGRCPRR